MAKSTHKISLRLDRKAKATLRAIDRLRRPAPSRKFRAFWGVFALSATLAATIIASVAAGWLSPDEARALGAALSPVLLLLGGGLSAVALGNAAEHWSRRGIASGYPCAQAAPPFGAHEDTPEAPPAVQDPTDAYVTPGGAS